MRYLKKQGDRLLQDAITVILHNTGTVQIVRVEFMNISMMKGNALTADQAAMGLVQEARIP